MMEMLKTGGVYFLRTVTHNTAVNGKENEMSIHKLLSEKSVEFKIKTGVNPTRAYLGDQEINALLQWAFENQYICKQPSEAVITGEHRPEVCGLLVYVVNDSSHFEVA